MKITNDMLFSGLKFIPNNNAKYLEIEDRPQVRISQHINKRSSKVLLTSIRMNNFLLKLLKEVEFFKIGFDNDKNIYVIQTNAEDESAIKVSNFNKYDKNGNLLSRRIKCNLGTSAIIDNNKSNYTWNKSVDVMFQSLPKKHFVILSNNGR